MYASRLSSSSGIPSFKGHAIALVKISMAIVSSSPHLSMSRRCLCVEIRSGLVEYSMINPSIACQNGSQLLAEAVEPKTMLVAKKYIFSAINLKAPVRSVFILGKWKQAAMSARARYILHFG